MYYFRRRASHIKQRPAMWGHRRSQHHRQVTLYDISTVLLVGLFLLAGFLYGGTPEQAQRRRASFQTGIDNVLGGMNQPQLVTAYGGIDDDPEINARVQAIFDQLVPTAEAMRDDLRLQVSVLKSDVPNAFSLPGGRNFITRGLISILDTDDEIAGVLGHELAHTIRSHGSKGFGRDLGMIVLYDFLLDYVSEDQWASAVEVGNLTYALISTGYSRQAETEADELGLYIAVGGGYDPVGLADALEKIEVYQREQVRQGNMPRQETPEFFRTHPLTENRVRHVRQLAADMGYDVYVPGDAVTEAARRYWRQVEQERESESVNRHD